TLKNSGHLSVSSLQALHYHASPLRNAVGTSSVWSSLHHKEADTGKRKTNAQGRQGESTLCKLKINRTSGPGSCSWSWAPLSRSGLPATRWEQPPAWDPATSPSGLVYA